MDIFTFKIANPAMTPLSCKKRNWRSFQWAIILLVLINCPSLLFAQVQINCVPGFPISCASDIITDVNAPFTSTTCPTGSNVTVTVAGPAIAGTNGCPGTTYTYTYMATDQCNQSASCQQVFTIANNIGPFITSCPAAKTVDCAYNVIPEPHLVQAESPCGVSNSVSVSGPEVVGTPNCPFTQYIYTYNVTDDCGQTTSCQQFFFLENEAPELIIHNNICIIECTEDPAVIANSFDAFAQNATVTTSCNGLETVITNNFNLNGFAQVGCNNNGFAIPNVQQSQYVTLTAIDPCGRTSVETILVLLVDNTSPVIEGEPYLTIRECDDLVQSEYDDWIADNLAGMTATDACSAVSWSHTPASPNEGPWVNGYAITHVIFTATDECGNTASKEIHFKLKNNHPPTWVGNLLDLSAECSDPMPAFDTPEFVHACGDTELTFVDVTTPGACPNEYSITRTWTVTDNCEGTNTTAQTISIVDTTAPVAPAAPADIIVQCADDIPAPVDLTAVDNCAGEITVSPSPQIIDEVCANQFTMIRTWTFDDGCGNVSSVSQTIEVNDTTAPEAPAAPADIMVQCADDIPAPVDLTAVDNCDGEITASPSPQIIDEVCANQLTMIRTWTFTDECGNVSSVSQTITVNDDTAPEAPAAPADIMVQCADDIPAPVDLTAVDNCDGEITASPSSQIIDETCANQLTMIRTWTFTDECGNVSSVSQTITVNDDTAPEAPTAPDDLQVSCANDVPDPDGLTAIDNCDGSIQAEPSIEIIDQTCPNKYTEIRTWTFVDDCGNASSVSQTIVVDDVIPPVAVDVPEDKVISCEEPVEFGPEPSWVDNCGGMIGIMSFEDDTIPGVCPILYSITRTWAVVDDCGILGAASQTITVTDDAPPVFTYVPPTPDVDCDQIPDWETPIAEDQCGEVTLTFTESISGDLCLDGYSWKRLWTATDACGNTAQVETAIWVNPDNQAPVFTYVPPTPDVDCDQIPDWETPIAEDQCGEVTLTFTESISGDLCLDGYSWKRLWTATDGCGNTAQVETAIWVNPDRDGPVFTFVPEGALISCDEFPPTFGEPIVEDACGAVTLTSFDQYIGNPNGCDVGENFDYERWWIATDECGNETTTKQTFWVKPNQAATGIVSGHLFTESQDMIEAVEVTVEGGSNAWSNSMTTNEEGAFDFELLLDNNYSITPERNDDVRNGISTLDLILISKHILGMELLDSPYKIIAADINNSGAVTAFDLVELSKLILHITDELPNNHSWRFIDESYVFVDPTHPFSNTFPERYDINGLSGETIVDFIGVKVGDVTGNAQANALMEGDTRSSQTLAFALEDQQLLAGESYTIDFKASDFQSILGYQFTLEFETIDLGFIDWHAAALPGLTMRNFGFNQLEEGYITGNWYHEKGWSAEDDEVLFQMTFKAAKDVRLSEVLRLNANYTQAEAYTIQEEQMDLELAFYEVNEAEKANNFQLLQNYPNPFKQTTQVRFILPEASSVTLTVYDLAGQVLQEIKGDFAKGYNEISLDKNDFIGSGIFYYRLDTPTRNAMKRMIMLHD